MKWFPSYFNVTVLLNLEEVTPGKLGIINIDAENDKIYEAFAISDERAKEIGRAAFDAYKKCKSFDKAVMQMEKQLKHVNELVYGMFILCEIRNTRQDPISMLLGGMIKGGSRE